MTTNNSNNMCRRCQVYFIPSANDPAVAAASLGAGIYHYACARLTWRDQAQKVEEKQEARTEKRRAGGNRLARWRAEMDAQIAQKEAAGELDEA